MVGPNIGQTSWLLHVLQAKNILESISLVKQSMFYGKLKEIITMMVDWLMWLLRCNQQCHTLPAWKMTKGLFGFLVLYFQIGKASDNLMVVSKLVGLWKYICISECFIANFTSSTLILSSLWAIKWLSFRFNGSSQLAEDKDNYLFNSPDFHCCHCLHIICEWCLGQYSRCFQSHQCPPWGPQCLPRYRRVCH